MGSSDYKHSRNAHVKKYIYFFLRELIRFCVKFNYISAYLFVGKDKP